MKSEILNKSSLSEQVFDKLKNEPSAQEIYDYRQKGGKCDGWICNPAVVDNFSKKLAEQNIAHACVKGEKNTIFISKEEDRELIRGVRKDLLKEAKVISEASLDQLKAKNIGGSIHSIKGVSEMYASVFKEEAKAAQISITVTDNKDGTFDVHYSGKDRSKVDSAIMNTIVATRGTIGKFAQERAALEISRDKELYEKIPDSQKEFYVVSHVQPNEYMHFTASGYEHYRNERLIGDELRSNKNFQIDSHKKIDSAFVKPVVLTKEEFEEARKLTREEYVKHISKKTTVAKPDIAELHRMELERMAKVVAEYKLSLENNELNTNFYEKSVSIAAFENREVITDKQMDKETEMSVSNPKSLPPEVEATLDKQQSLPIEDREYVDERVKEYLKEVRRTKDEIEVVEVTKEDLAENLDLMIANLTEEITSTETIEREDLEI